MSSGILRIALALIVVVHHLSRLGVGKACVFLFFVLSGFWVARMWNDKYRHCDAPWRTFVLARFLRIWPLFVLANLLGTFALAALGHPIELPCAGDHGAFECGRALVANSLILGYASTPAQAIPPAWSLDIELQFYLIAPLLVHALRQQSGWWVALGTLPLAVAATFAFVDTLPEFLPFFVLGVLSATEKLRIDRRTAIASGAATAALVLWSLTTATGRSLVLTGATPGPLVQYNEAFNALIAALAAPFALFLATRERQGRAAALGDIAFAIYIVHWVPVEAVTIHWGHLPAAQRLPYVVGAIVATIGLALVLWRCVDRPMEHWRRGLSKMRRRAARLAPPPSA